MTNLVAEEIVRPVYRHVVVKRKSPSALVADPATLKRARDQQLEVANGTREAVDSDLEHLMKRDHLRQTMKKVYGEGFSEETSRSTSSGQGAIIVATLNQVQVPGGQKGEPLPQSAVFWSELAVTHDGTPPQQAFIGAAQKLQRRFQQAADQKVCLLPPEMIAGVTLVTVVYAPIAAYALPMTGFEVGMEFFQTTRFGSIDAAKDGFVVYSDDGTYPISPPTDGYLTHLMKSVGDLGALPGFLTEEQREEAVAYKASKKTELPG